MKVLFRGDFTSVEESGYTARAYCEALLSVGTDMLYEEFAQPSPRIALGKFWKEQLDKNKERDDHAAVKVWNETPNTYSPSPAMKNVALVSWDASIIPTYGDQRDNWAAQLNKMNLVWTPSTYAKEAMVKSGVTTDIEVIPYPINTRVFKPAKERIELYDPARQHLHAGWFKILSVFPYTHKSDPSSLLLAYLSEFKAGEETALVLRTHVSQSGGLSTIKQFIDKFRKELRLQDRGPRIFLVPGTLNDQDMAELIRGCDCSVVTTKGSETARSQLESMACGVPVIAPNGSAFKDHINETNGYPVQVVEEPVNGMSSIPWYYCTQTWHRVDIMDLRERMREAYEQRTTLGHKSEAAITSVRAVATEAVGRRMQKSLATLLGS